MGWKLPDGTDFKGSNSGGIIQGALGGISDATSSAWDIMSGNRDYRRDTAAADKAWDREMGASNTSHQREMADLAAAGINPMLAGQMGGAGTPRAHVPQSHSAQSLSGSLGAASSVLGASAGAIGHLATAQAARAGSALSLAQAGDILRRQPGNIAHTAAQTMAANASAVASQAGAGLSRSHSAESVARTVSIENDRNRQKAESKYYHDFGRAGVMADKMRNPWQTAVLGSQAVPNIIPPTGSPEFDALRSAIGHSAAALSESAARAGKKVDRNVRPKSRSYSGPSYFNPGGR